MESIHVASRLIENYAALHDLGAAFPNAAHHHGKFEIYTIYDLDKMAFNLEGDIISAKSIPGDEQ